ncbi:RNA-guided endonuclease InsQ/TnpB family protein [Streptomyces sp. HUCO-GS316]|uniref:RNA-guided endonuclease InsQ/TnpB family protein n=1 Tax=Streptomyces sp. HUCO-GS316 TaxID=2692198 RepID=UPI001F48A80D|nr:transposase [Streptomyces sp. HUCO-GS316]
MHKQTTAVAAEYGTLVVEDLNVAGMLRNRRLARRIADAGFGEICHQLDYQTRQRHATRTSVASRWYPSSKTCSGCGAVKANLPLHVRTYHCDACGLALDRDDKAAQLRRYRRSLHDWYRCGRRPGHRPGGVRWHNPAAPAAGGSERPSSSRNPHALVM